MANLEYYRVKPALLNATKKTLCEKFIIRYRLAASFGLS